MEIDKIDYLIINCKYVYILNDYLKCINKDNLNDNLKYKFSDQDIKKNIKKCINELRNLSIFPLFLYDNIYGNGLHIFEKDLEVEKLLGIITVKKLPINDIICMKCSSLNKAFCAIELFKQFNCIEGINFLNIFKLIYNEIDEKKILYVIFDENYDS